MFSVLDPEHVSILYSNSYLTAAVIGKMLNMFCRSLFFTHNVTCSAFQIRVFHIHIYIYTDYRHPRKG